MAEYGRWRVLELKQELIKRGAPTKGKKCDLVERLVLAEQFHMLSYTNLSHFINLVTLLQCVEPAVYITGPIPLCVYMNTSLGPTQFCDKTNYETD